ncbi:portal protein [Acidovorax sp.]|uniref:portal protein n=1 Tax=Acidovorax sp. TaxID=1872122 RepID=UPI0026270E4C|nr:portal protein [Acidovorax sp.]
MTKDEILSTAKERFERSLERSAHNREKMREDIRFAAATPDDPWHWSKDDQTARKGRPMLTINKMPQHIRQVTNDIRQNRPSIRFRPADDKADPEVAEILMGLVRHIEANSDADIAYDTASEHQVVHGLGYIRVLSDYISETSFDQDIFIGRVKDPFKVYDDPDAQDPAGADRKWLFIEETLKEADFKAQYPDAEPIDWSHVSDAGWFSGDKDVRVVEYFEVVEKSATLLLWANGATSYKGDPMPDGVFMGEQPIKTRKATKCSVVWRKLNGQQVLEEKEFPSKFIPFARVVGNEWEVDGKNYMFGLVRNAKDSQRMYNVAQSAIVERVLQAPKAPWAAPAEAVEGYEKIWQTANTDNHSYLPYNHVDEGGNPIPPPQRTSPTMVEAGLNQIAMGAADDIKSETGQYDASLGQKSNETSGRAIMARQREGDTATYHYVDNLARAVRHIGRIVLDMIPKVLDTKRIARIIGEDDEQQNATLDPNNPEALTEYDDDQGAMQRIFNPTIGTYDVYTTTGPSFTTRRVEAVEAMTAMTQANPQLWQVIGDLLVKNMDWPGADDMSKRLKLTLLPQVQAEVSKEDGGEPEVPPQIKQAMDQMQQQIEQMGEALGKAGDHVDKLEADHEAAEHANRIAEQGREVDRFKAETERLKLVLPYLKPESVAAIAESVGLQAQTTPDIATAADDMDDMGQMEPQAQPTDQPPDPMHEPQATEQPADAGFFTPEGQQV